MNVNLRGSHKWKAGKTAAAEYSPPHAITRTSSIWGTLFGLMTDELAEMHLNRLTEMRLAEPSLMRSRALGTRLCTNINTFSIDYESASAPARG
jgi:hypothetical protein